MERQIILNITLPAANKVRNTAKLDMNNTDLKNKSSLSTKCFLQVLIKTGSSTYFIINGLLI